MINMRKDLIEKVDNVYEQMGNNSRKKLRRKTNKQKRGNLERTK